MDVLQVQKGLPSATLPTTASECAAGFDLFSAVNITIKRFQRAVVDTGVIVSFPPGTYGRIADKSGLAVNNGVIIGGGVIDCDYRGTIKVIVFNLSEFEFIINEGIAIGQLICECYKKPPIIEKIISLNTIRGNKGLGSGFQSLESTFHSFCGCNNQACSEGKIVFNFICLQSNINFCLQVLL